MKKILALASFLLIASACTNQPSTNTTTPANAPATAANAAPSEADIAAHEKAAWESLKKKDYVAFGNMLDSNYIEVQDTGIVDKAGIIASVKDLNVTDTTYSDWKLLSIDNDAAIISYTLTLKGTYKGAEIPAGPYHSVATWVNRDGKWLGFFYQQTLIKTGPPPPPAAAAKLEKPAAPAAKPGVTGPDPIANEKIVWDLFRARNTEGFATLLDPAFVEIEENAVYDKAAAVKGAEFDASIFSESEWKAAKIDNDAALVTYLVKSTDPKMDSQRHTTIWANRGGKWVALLHIGTTVAKAPAAKPEAKKM